MPLNVDVRDPVFGAVGNGEDDDTAAIQKAIDAVGAAGGGRVFFPPGRYLVSRRHDGGTGDVCLWVAHHNITLEGCGRASVITTRVPTEKLLNPIEIVLVWIANRYIPILFSSDLDTSTEPSSVLEGCAVRHLTVEGTGNAEYFQPSGGLGILARKVRNFELASCTVLNLSMIGICVEDGYGYISIHDNRVDNCFYTAINFNGRAPQSRISGNIVSRALFPLVDHLSDHIGPDRLEALRKQGLKYWPNSSLIQSGGPVIIEGNTVYDCGGAGIMWGEGNYHGVGVIANNLVKGCRSSGIKAAYHGPCTIQGNTVICCTGIAGIFLSGDTKPEHRLCVGNKNNVVCGNLIVNCYPIGIACYTKACTITGNQIQYLESPVQWTAEAQPDYIGWPEGSGVGPNARTEFGIEFNRDSFATVVGNVIGSPPDAPKDTPNDAPQYGIAVPFGDNSNTMLGNQIWAVRNPYILHFLDTKTTVDFEPVETNDTEMAKKMYVESTANVVQGDDVVADMSNNELFFATVTGTGSDEGANFVTLDHAPSSPIAKDTWAHFYHRLAHPVLP